LRTARSGAAAPATAAARAGGLRRAGRPPADHRLVSRTVRTGEEPGRRGSPFEGRRGRDALTAEGRAIACGRMRCGRFAVVFPSPREPAAPATS
jgi:hypothetical protein